MNNYSSSLSKSETELYDLSPKSVENLAEAYKLFNRKYPVLKDTKRAYNTVPARIAKLKAGIFGRVRPYLTTKDVMDVINHQLMTITAEDISGIINTFPKKDMPLALKILERMTQFGNVESLNEIAGMVLDKELMILHHSHPSLSSNMEYLNHKGSFKDFLEFRLKRGICLLDNITLERLEQDKKFKKLIVDNPDITIIYPEGWINGVNPFNQTMDIKSQLAEFVKKANNILDKEPNKSLDDAISDVLNNPVKDRISGLVKNKKRRLKLQNKFQVIQNSKISYKLEPTAEKIAAQLKPASITKDQLDEILAKYPNKYKPYFLEFLVQNTKILSPRALSVNLKTLNQKIVMSNRGSDKGIYYYMPTDYKSFGMILMQYMITNKIPYKSMITYRQAIPADAKKIVVLDDLAGSGDSLDKCFSTLMNFKLDKIKPENMPEIILSPVLSTNDALKLLSKAEKYGKKPKNMPCEIIPSFIYNSYFKSLTDQQQYRFERVIGYLGIGNNTLCVASPFTSPDNGCGLWSTLAGFFTFNGKGVVPYYYYIPEF